MLLSAENLMADDAAEMKAGWLDYIWSVLMCLHLLQYCIYTTIPMPLYPYLVIPVS